MAERVWDARTTAHRQHFIAHVLAPLIAITRPMDLRTPEAVDDAARAWVMALSEIPAPVLEAGVERLVTTCGRWMPAPDDLRRACADVVAERRKALAPAAAAITAECVQCDGSGFERVAGDDGFERVKRCGCRARALALFEGVPEPIALPPGREGDDTAA